MKVRTGSLSDEQRQLIFRANREARSVLIAAISALVLDNLGPSGQRGPGQYVGVPQGWGYESLTIGSPSGSFSTQIRWVDIRGVWMNDEHAPSTEAIAAEFLL